MSNWFSDKNDVIKNIDKLGDDLRGQIFLYLPIETRISLFTDRLGTKLLLILKAVLREYYSIEELYKLNTGFIKALLKEFETSDPKDLVNTRLKTWLPSIYYKSGCNYGFDGKSFIESCHPYIDAFTRIIGIDFYRYSSFNIIVSNMPVYYTYIPNNELFNPSKAILNENDYNEVPEYTSFKRRNHSFGFYSSNTKRKVFDTWKPEDIISKLKALFNSFTTNRELDNKIYNFAYKILTKLYFTKKFKRRFRRYKHLLRKRLLEKQKMEEEMGELQRRREMYQEEKDMNKFLKKEKRHLRSLELERNKKERKLKKEKKYEELKEKRENLWMKSEDKCMTKAAILKRKKEKKL